ncbi:hypothetical protein [Cohnella yongneupensis]|uniref:Phosphoribulokinase/uridine kinase domain-containing protein n=1 Tax=Cohnella yongneupensis TaxID=425006 RepID=A0ABW0QUB3_9BACL
MNSYSIVICISGPSGAGKSSLMERTVEILNDSVSFYFDAYKSTLTFPDLDDAFRRISEGEVKDPLDILRYEIRNDKFYEDLCRLSQGYEVTDPWGRKLKPAKYIILEEPYGRLREGMNALIHTSVCIDVPLEISLCRRLIRNITYDLVKETAETRLDNVLEYIKSYHEGEGMAIKLMYEALKEESDLIFDGLKPKELLVQELINYIRGIS